MLRWKDGEFITPFLIDAERAPGIRTIPISPFALLAKSAVAYDEYRNCEARERRGIRLGISHSTKSITRTQQLSKKIELVRDAGALLSVYRGRRDRSVDSGGSALARLRRNRQGSKLQNGNPLLFRRGDGSERSAARLLFDCRSSRS